ncbi:flagellar basal-body MS-ring/collar protein FliF [Pontibaca salina]|uniref:Flagellar M-ring protein n=1 Tax=Pontibaca salina TaxID=2795731 RepID=A0A934M0R3_9RHOB|nr:flagellar basal-body MS-ring/collar protein FliF [Pontibaca salina]MBI6628916.1 flagellar M-ring protein FliF [Pontibaca salina]
MQRIVMTWTGLEKRRQVIVVIASLIMALTIAIMLIKAATPSMKLLYAGLEPSAAGEVVRVLDQRGASYDVRGGSIYVPFNQRDELRMILAGEGVPTNGGRGYELLDSLSGFGTTSQMFDAAYWRAKEGELARTIVASPHIVQARVHLANAGSSPFYRSAEPTASIAVTTAAGAPITADQANAIRFLVASAVSGLPVENVAVIDANGILIGISDNSAPANSADDRAQKVRNRVLRLLEARVGAGNAVVEVSVDTVTDTESIRRRQIDPEARVAISTDSEERTDSSRNQAQGAVTVASNLPDGDAAYGGDGSHAQTSETRERVNYEISQTDHEILRAPGAVKRLTVAVLINGVFEEDANGVPRFQPRSDAELTALHDLVASAVGYDAERGDMITLRSMELPAEIAAGTTASASLLSGLGLDLMSLVQIFALSIVTLVLGLFVVRPILTKPKALPPPILTAEAEKSATAPAPTLPGVIDGKSAKQALPANQGASEVSRALAEPDTGHPVDRLRSMIGERQEETVEILRSWLEEEREGKA